MSTHSLGSALLLCCTVGLVYISFTTAAPVGSHNVHAIEKRGTNVNDESFGDVTKESFGNKFEGDNSTVRDAIEDHVDSKEIEDEVPNEKDNVTEEYDDEIGDFFQKSEENNNDQQDDTHTESSSEKNGKVDVPEHDNVMQKNGEHIDDHDSTFEHLDDQNERIESSLSEQENLNSNQESNAEKTEANSGDEVESSENQEMDLQSEDKHHEDSGETMEKEAERESHSELDDVDDLSTKEDFHSSDIVEENDNTDEDHIEEDKTDMIDSEVIEDKFDNKDKGEPAHLEVVPVDEDLHHSEGSGSQEHADINSKGSDELKTEEHELHSENLDDESESLAKDNDDTSVHSYEDIEDNDDKDAIMSNENVEKSDDTLVDKSLDVSTENDVTEENENDNKSNDAAPQYQDSEKGNVDGDDILDAAVNLHDSSHEHSSYNEDDLKYGNDNTQENEEENIDSINHDEGASSENDQTDDHHDEENNTSDEKIEGNVSSDHKTQSGEGQDESMNTLSSHHYIDEDTEKENTEEHDELNEHDEVTSLEKVEEHNEHHESDENDSTTHEAGESLLIKTNDDALKAANDEDTRKSDDTYDEDGSVAVDDEIIPHEDEDKTSQDNEEKNASAIENNGDKSDLSQENVMDSVGILHDTEENESINSNVNESASEQDSKDIGTNENQGEDVRNESDGDMDVIPVPRINEDNELEEDENENESVNEHNLRNNSQEEDELDRLSNLSVPYDTDKTLQDTEEEHENKDNSSQEKENEHDVTDDSVLAIDKSLLTSQQSEEANDKLEEHEDNKESELQETDDESGDSVNGEFNQNIGKDNEDGEHSNSHHKEENDVEVSNLHIPYDSENNSPQEDEENRTSEHHDEDTVSSTSIPHGDVEEEEDDDDDDYDYEDDDDEDEDGVGSLLISHEEVSMSQENEERKDENRSDNHEDGDLKENSKDDDDDDEEEEEAFISSKHHEVSGEFVSHTNVDSNDEQTVDVNKYENGDHNETSGRRVNEEDTDVLQPVSRRQELYEDNGKDQKDTLQDFFTTLLEEPSHSENDSESHSTIQTDNHKVTIKPLEPFAQDTNEETPEEEEENLFWLVDSGNNGKEKDDDYLAVTKEPQESHDLEDGSGSGEPVTENPVERTDAKIFDTALQIPNEQDETTEKIQEPIDTSLEQSESGSGNSESAGTRNEDLILQSSKKNLAEQSKVSGVNEVGVGQDSEDPNAETQQTSTGSYVVLGVIMAIIVALLGYSVLRSRRRSQAAKPEEDFGTEMKDVEKSLLPSTGNGNVRTSRHSEGIDDEDDESKTKLLSPMNVEDGDSKPTKIVVNGDDMKFNDMVTIESQNEAANSPASEPASTVSSASPNVHHEHVIEIGKSKSPTQMARERLFNMNPYQQSSIMNEDDRISESAIEKTSPHNGLVNGNSDGSAFVNGHVLDDLPSSKVKVMEKMDEDSVLKKPVFVNNGKSGIPC